MSCHSCVVLKNVVFSVVCFLVEVSGRTQHGKVFIEGADAVGFVLQCVVKLMNEAKCQKLGHFEELA